MKWFTKVLCMNVDLPKKKCPFCRQEAYVAEVEIEGGFPEDRLEVRCSSCGEYFLPSKVAHLEEEDLVIDSIKNLLLDTELIARTNKYAQAEGKMILWLDSFVDVNKWEEVIKEYSHHYGGMRPFEVRVVTDCVKES